MYETMAVGTKTMSRLFMSSLLMDTPLGVAASSACPFSISLWARAGCESSKGEEGRSAGIGVSRMTCGARQKLGSV
jgi:hypothetical protein